MKEEEEEEAMKEEEELRWIRKRRGERREDK